MLRSEAAGLYYWENYQKTRNTFVGGGWVTNNDLFWRDQEGNYWFAGRADDLVKVRGTFVSPGEIEACLERHPAIAECAVVAVEDEDGLTTTKAFVATREGFAPSEVLIRDIQEFAKQRLAPHKYPRHVGFLPDLPKTGQGKINRRRLREIGI